MCHYNVSLCLQINHVSLQCITLSTDKSRVPTMYHFVYRQITCHYNVLLCLQTNHMSLLMRAFVDSKMTGHYEQDILAIGNTHVINHEAHSVHTNHISKACSILEVPGT